MKQTQDFQAEAHALATILAELSPEDWTRATQFKNWTVNDVMVHLHFWNMAADVSHTDPDRFAALMAEALPAFKDQGMRAFENAQVEERGSELFSAWLELVDDMAKRWENVDGKTRLAWAGPDMSARSMMTARQMETWAHGQEIFDLFGREQPQDDRIQNIVFLGVNTFAWSHQVHGQPVPDSLPELRLTAPSGEIWTYGTAGSGELIEGDAVEFAQVVAQTRNIADTSLVVHGEVAKIWMRIAQCFAGPPETPPEKGARFRVATA